MKMQISENGVETIDEMSIPVSDMNFTTRPSNVFSKCGIRVIRQLVEHTAEELMGLKGFGAGCLDEVRQKLSERGFKLKGD
jgi:DNA-directed RNA polymerase alpha subunit